LGLAELVRCDTRPSTSRRISLQRVLGLPRTGRSEAGRPPVAPARPRPRGGGRRLIRAEVVVHPQAFAGTPARTRPAHRLAAGVHPGPPGRPLAPARRV